MPLRLRARLGSFTRAAEELAISQAAVSLSVKRLEETLQVKLFHREYRKIILTEKGEKFFNDVSLGMAHIQRAAEEACARTRPDHVTLSISTAFASYWMLPRLGRWRQAHPEIDLRLQTTDKDVDLSVEGITLGIRRGDGEWSGYESVLLAAEEIYPVCSPDYLEALGPVERPEDLLKARLIIFEEAFRYRPGWADWFKSFGVTAPKQDGLPINDYATALHAAVEGHGVAMGWRHLTEGLLNEGRLVRPLPDKMVTEMGFYLVWPRGRQLTMDASDVVNWLLQEAAADMRLSAGQG